MTLNSDTDLRAAKLREQLNYHNHRYYVLDEPEIPDVEYDMMQIGRAHV